MQVLAMSMRVMSVEDVLVGKLLSVSEQYLEYGAPLEAARSMREKVDWMQVRRRTSGSPYARAFMGLLEELEVVEPLAEAPALSGGPAAAAALASASGSELAQGWPPGAAILGVRARGRRANRRPALGAGPE
jgi:hypothetical protein